MKLSGLGSNSQAKEAIKVGFDYFQAKAAGAIAYAKVWDHDYHVHVVELHNTGPSTAMIDVSIYRIVLCDPWQTRGVKKVERTPWPMIPNVASATQPRYLPWMLCIAGVEPFGSSIVCWDGLFMDAFLKHTTVA
ncbi:hypothetical protein OAL01_01680 [Rubripirellula sp.]|nr:hypothetical protein [Rubripirellula sp.]